MLSLSGGGCLPLHVRPGKTLLGRERGPDVGPCRCPCLGEDCRGRNQGMGNCPAGFAFQDSTGGRLGRGFGRERGMTNWRIRSCSIAAESLLATLVWLAAWWTRRVGFRVCLLGRYRATATVDRWNSPAVCSGLQFLQLPPSDPDVRRQKQTEETVVRSTVRSSRKVFLEVLVLDWSRWVDRP